MKPVIRTLLALICLIPACGGRIAGDFENGMTSSAGASFDDETGGASNTTTIAQATGGSFSNTASGGTTGITQRFYADPDGDRFGTAGDFINADQYASPPPGYMNWIDGRDNDNCPSVYNPDQKDTDQNGIGDACENSQNGTGGSPAVQTTASTGGARGILHLLEPSVRELPGRTVLLGEKDVTVFEFTLSAEQRNIRIPRMYVGVTGSIKNDELMPVTIVDEANNIVATENPTPFGEVYTFSEYGGAFWLTPFTVDASAPPKTFRVKTGIESTAQIGKTFRFSIDTATSLYPTVDDLYEVQACDLAIKGSQFTVVGNPDTNNGTGGAANNTSIGGSTSIGAGGTTSIGSSSANVAGSSTITTGTAVNTTGSNVVDTTLEITTPETTCLQTTKIKLPDDAVSNNNKAIGPFCCTGKTMTIRDRENNPIGYVYFYSFPSGNIIGDSSYAPSADIYISAAPTYGSNDPQIQSNVSFTVDDMEQGKVKTVSVGALTYTLKITHADILIQGKTKLFNMNTLRAEAVISLSEKTICPTLVISLSKDTPKSQSVVSTEYWSGNTYSDYTVKNTSNTIQHIETVTVSGTLKNFISVNVVQCLNDQVLGLTVFSPNSQIFDDTGSFINPFHPNTSAHFTDNAPVVFDFIGGADLPINPGEELQVRVSGPLSAIQATDGPKSGDLIQLKITDVVDRNGNHAYFDGPNDPPKMTLQ